MANNEIEHTKRVVAILHPAPNRTKTDRANLNC